MTNKVKYVVLPILVVLALLGFLALGQYNGLVSSQATVEQAESNIQVQLQRRNDLIDNLVASVRGTMRQEQRIVGSITDARKQVRETRQGSDENIQAQGQLDSAVSRLLVTVENYPELKSNENVRDLMTELEGSENRLSVARKDYNAAATNYNLKIRRFPGNIFAGIYGFEKVSLFEATEQAQTSVPSVNLED